MITSQGYARAWPDTFSEGPNANVNTRASSVLTKAMDVARSKFVEITFSIRLIIFRGRKFTTVLSSSPALRGTHTMTQPVPIHAKQLSISTGVYLHGLGL